jgi:DNA-binding PadR family transcriptional regulator
MNWGFGFDLNDFFGAGPGGRWRGPRRGFFRPGEVRLALLSLLQQAPGHGYDLMKRLEERSGGMYQASAGTVYPVLQQLEDEGLVRARESDGKKVYEITEAGRAELGRQKDAVDGIWTRAGRWREAGCRMGPDTVEVAAALGRLTRSAFAAAGDGKRAERVVEILNRARGELETVR